MKKLIFKINKIIEIIYKKNKTYFIFYLNQLML